MNPEKIKSTREKAGITQQQAANLVQCGTNTWRHWEAGRAKMPACAWELFHIKLPMMGKEISRTNIFDSAKGHYADESIDKPYRRHDTIRQSSLASIGSEKYMHTIVATTLGAYIETYTPEEIAIAACEDSSNGCVCGYHRYNGLDEADGLGGWYLP